MIFTIPYVSFDKKRMEENYQHIALENIDLSLSDLRIIHSGQINSMERSIKQFGQQQPIVLRRLDNKDYQLVDGFKRYYAFENLGKHNIYSQLLDVEDLLATAMMITYNKSCDSLNLLEESLIVQRLRKEHLMDQDAISRILGYSRSWVCRRLSLVEKLDENVRTQIRLGVLTSSHGRELLRLPRGNQNEVMKTIVNNNLTTKQTHELISKYTKSGNLKEKEYILAEPFKVISVSETDGAVYDTRLSEFGNKLLKTSHILQTQLHILTGQLSHNKDTYLLKDIEFTILSPKLSGIVKKSEIVISQITTYLHLQGHER